MSGAADDLAGIVLAAGAGERLRPLTFERPKALCPVGNVALVDAALARLQRATRRCAVNLHHGRAAMEEHFAERADVHLSIEEERALGTAGAVGALREWLGGRHALIVNADTWCDADLRGFVAGWDRERVHVLLHGPAPFGPRAEVVASLLPAGLAAGLEPVPSGLYELVWRSAAAQGVLDTSHVGGAWIDCGTPAQYLAANLQAVRAATATDGSARSIIAEGVMLAPDAHVGGSAIGRAARVEGTVIDSVVWPGAVVARHERLARAIRTPGGRTVFVR